MKRNNCIGRIKRVYYESYGCPSNRFDLEVMLGRLVEAGLNLTRKVDQADIILINTCGVKTPTESRMLERIRVLSKYGRPMIVAGCLPRINLEALRKVIGKRTVMLDPHTVDRIVEAVRYLEEGGDIKILFSDKPSIKTALSKIRINPAIEIVQIAEGCAGACSYCCVRFARGKLFSYPQKVILQRIEEAVSAGVKEIWITSQDNGAYGLDRNTSLSDLLKRIVEIQGDFYIRVGMMNPQHVKRILRSLIDVYKNSKIFKFLHIPLQSGDNNVLRLMNRYYTVEDFKNIVMTFREDIPKITIATDVIVGFPGESREAFNHTLNIIEEIKPDIVNVSRFFPRPGTPAKDMQPIPYDELKNRSKLASKVSLRVSLERNKLWKGWEGHIIIDEKGKGSSWIGRNFAYKPIVIKSEHKNLIGKIAWVRVTEVHETYLKADLLKFES